MPEPVFAHVELKIVPREMQRFLDTMQVIAPLMNQAGRGFVGAWQVKVGRAPRCGSSGGCPARTPASRRGNSSLRIHDWRNFEALSNPRLKRKS